jgi:hypothetical protein
MLSEEFRRRDREKMAREKQSAANGFMMFEEVKSPSKGGGGEGGIMGRSSSLSKASNGEGLKSKVTLKGKM